MAMGMALATNEGGSMSGKDQTQLLGGAVRALVERLDEDEVLQIIKNLVDTAECDGKKIIFETHFQGKIGHLFKVVYAVLEVQYSDFLGEALSMVAESGLMTAKSSTATGESGA